MTSTAGAEPRTEQRPSSEEIDWFSSRPPAPPISDLPLAYTPPPPGPFAPEPVPSAAPQPPPAFPPLADAFAALLAAEQSAPAPGVAPAWPGPPPPPNAGPVAASNELVEEVTSRVLQKLSDHAVRETVAEIVSTIAERLVREEIERIKNSIK